MKSSRNVYFCGLIFALAAVAVFLMPAMLTAHGGGQFEAHMKIINKNFKAIKSALAAGKSDVVKSAALAIAAEVVQVKDLEPPHAVDRKAELPPLADKAAEAAKALSESSAEEAKLKFDALEKCCKTCHDIFQHKI